MAKQCGGPEDWSMRRTDKGVQDLVLVAAFWRNEALRYMRDVIFAYAVAATLALLLVLDAVAERDWISAFIYGLVLGSYATVAGMQWWWRRDLVRRSRGG